MHVLVIGGNGRTGRLVVDESLRRGHTVTALVRNPVTLDVRAGLTIIKGTPMSTYDIEKAFDASESGPPTAIIITLNAPRKSDNPWAAVVAPPRLMADCHANVVAIMKSRGIQKLVSMAAFGVGDSLPSASIVLRCLIKHSNMSYQFEDHGAVDKEVKASEVEYVLARPTVLTQGDAQPVKTFGNLGKSVRLTSTITRCSVAVFLVDAAEKNDWNKSTPVITN